MNEGLFTAYYDLPQWQKLLTRLNAGDCTALSEIAEGERPFFAAALEEASRAGVTVLYLPCHVETDSLAITADITL